MSGSPPDPMPPDQARVNGRAYVEEAEKVVTYLNATAGRSFPFRTPAGGLTANAKIIIARLKQGYTGEQLREVAHLKSEQWKADAKMAEYLRPETLFGERKFSQYVGELKL